MATQQITGRQIKADAVDDTHIDWGTSTNQVSQEDIPSGFTTGSIPFVGAASGILTEDNSNLFWDNTNKYLGIGTASPGEMFTAYSTANRSCFLVGGATSHTPLYSTMDSQDWTLFEFNSPWLASLSFVGETSGTSTAIGSMAWSNKYGKTPGTDELRIASIVARTNGTTDTGKLYFYTSKAGVEGNAVIDFDQDNYYNRATTTCDFAGDIVAKSFSNVGADGKIQSNGYIYGTREYISHASYAYLEIDCSTSNTGYNIITQLNSNDDALNFLMPGRSTSGTWLGLNRAGGSFITTNPNVLFAMGTTNAKPMIFATNNTEKMRINSAGEVGIGMTATEKLDVNGTIKGTGYKSSDGSAGLSGTMTLDDGANWRVTMTFKNGLLTAQTTGASSGAAGSWA